MDHVATFCWTLLPHTPYSPELAPSDFHLFGPMNVGLGGHHFPDDAAEKMWVTSAGADLYECGMKALVHRWRKCIVSGDDYVEIQCYVAETLLYPMVLLCCLYPL